MNPTFMSSEKSKRAVENDGDTSNSREFEFSARDFARVKDMILKRAGISLADHKQSMVYSRLVKRIRALGKQSFTQYLDGLGGDTDPEWEHFVNALTTNLTSFYREAHHFEILSRYMLSLSNRTWINLWCCAASTGEEPYTLAITAMEAFGTLTPPVRIVATDIDTEVLETAKRGVYRMEAVQNLPLPILKKYFLKGSGPQEGFVRVRPELQALLQFRRLNLLENTWPVSGPFDAVFCRNVMIYFERDVQMGILKRFAPMMNERGLLFAGHSENLAMAKDYFELRGKTVYQVTERGRGR